MLTVARRVAETALRFAPGALIDTTRMYGEFEVTRSATPGGLWIPVASDTLPNRGPIFSLDSVATMLRLAERMTLEFVVTRTGHVDSSSVSILSHGPGPRDAEIIEVVRRLRFAPARVSGYPVAVRMRVTIEAR
jgi:TonB family protein